VVIGRCPAHHVLEIADEVGLIGIAELESQAGEVDRIVPVPEALSGLDESLSSDHPFRTHPDLVAK
jgi:hypothetical protein